ncbi:hypothetical protein GDO81_004293 [Engystomops pustulosus]|uniref:Uncharacterized protein n=1 Tax=Engystomops pustulosus TaxID=76066 RepID=A0AAV6ZW85_ENGPU|nr:hypothetical protein GDO81_004293 [Engystomops pustulosus]
MAIYERALEKHQTIPQENLNPCFQTARHGIMSSILKQAQDKADETVKSGEKAAQDYVDKGKEVGKQVIDKGCEAAKNTCDQVTGQVEDKLTTGAWIK